MRAEDRARAGALMLIQLYKMQVFVWRQIEAESLDSASYKKSPTKTIFCKNLPEYNAEGNRADLVN